MEKSLPRRGLTTAAIIVVPVLAALFVTSSQGMVVPWRAVMEDFSVYRDAATKLLHGQDLYAASRADLPFIYPPFAALVVLPAAISPLWVAQVGWTVVAALLLVAMLAQLGLRGWRLMLAAIAAMLMVDPVKATLVMGQINILITALVCLDLAPGARGLHRRLPTGVLTGLATAIKLTPAVFVVCLWLAGRRREAYVAAGSFAAATALGWLILPRQSLAYWGGLLGGGGSGISHGVVYYTNQSVLGTYVRDFGSRPDDVGVVALGLAGLTLLLTVVGTVLWSRLGEPGLALGLCGAGSLLASPIAWNHHFVWIVPLGIVALTRAHLPVLLRVSILGWCVWVAGGDYLTVGGDGYEEMRYSFVRQLADSATALGGLVLLVAALLAGVRGWRRSRAATASLAAASCDGEGL